VVHEAGAAVAAAEAKERPDAPVAEVAVELPCQRHVFLRGPATTASHRIGSYDGVAGPFDGGDPCVAVTLRRGGDNRHRAALDEG